MLAASGLQHASYEPPQPVTGLSESVLRPILSDLLTGEAANRFRYASTDSFTVTTTIEREGWQEVAAEALG